MVTNVGFNPNVGNMNYVGGAPVSNPPLYNQGLAKADKQQIMKQARQNASGWAIFGGPLSTLYYAFRSDKTVAEKYNLDVDKDKQFIKQIKKKQMLWTLPGALIKNRGAAVVSYLYNRFKNPAKIDV